MIKTIIISDIHIGTPEAKLEKLLLFLKKNPCENLIINWDFIDELYITFFWKWTPAYADIIRQIISICKKNNTKIFYIKGNHEVSFKYIAWLKAFTIVEDMIYISQNKKYYICHGHQFGIINRNLSPLSYLCFFFWSFLNKINRFYNRLRLLLNMHPHSLVMPIHNYAKYMIGGKKKLYQKICATTIEKKCNGIICWHFHKTEDSKLWDIHYLNSGEWIETWSAIIETQIWEWKIFYPNIDGTI